LRSIKAQSVQPLEIIVIDNNSTDNTREVVRRFKDVKLLTAKRQGVVHARNRGFNAVRGDIIGRIDADTRLPRNWVATVQKLFTDSDLSAVSGAVHYYDIPGSRFLSNIDLYLRRQAAQRMEGRVFLQGANMAVRTSAWRSIRKQLCNRSGMHEDYDLAIHLSDAGHTVQFSEALRANISTRCLDDTVQDFWTYALLSPGTYAQHDVRAGRHMFPIVILILTFHVPLRALYRLANAPELAQYQRVNPATFGD
jgi:cellulose synthase/poly-beta-1,6-N-acetylglucosamine synthase-like glycosyltransferase